MWCICQRMWQLSLRVLEKLTQWQGKEVWCGVFASVSGSSQCVLDKNWHSDRERKFDAACLPVCVAAVTVCAWQKLKQRQGKEVWGGVFASVCGSCHYARARPMKQAEASWGNSTVRSWLVTWSQIRFSNHSATPSLSKPSKCYDVFIWVVLVTQLTLEHVQFYKHLGFCWITHFHQICTNHPHCLHCFCSIIHMRCWLEFLL